MKKSVFYPSLYIDAKGLHWMALEKTKSGYQFALRLSQPFSQIFGESQFAALWIADGRVVGVVRCGV